MRRATTTSSTSNIQQDKRKSGIGSGSSVGVGGTIRSGGIVPGKRIDAEGKKILPSKQQWCYMVITVNSISKAKQ